MPKYGLMCIQNITLNTDVVVLHVMPLLLIGMLSDIIHRVATAVLLSVKNTGFAKKFPQPGGILQPLCKEVHHDTVCMLTLAAGSRHH